MNQRGYISPRSTTCGNSLQLGDHVVIDDGVVIYAFDESGEVRIDMCVRCMRDVIIQTGSGGRGTIGSYAFIHPRTILSAVKGAIHIGQRVQIAANCAFFPYNHGLTPDIRIMEQEITSKGAIIVENDVWIGSGAIVIDGVHIGEGAVIGACSVVTRDIPPYTLAVGNPARVVRSLHATHETKDSGCV